MKIRCGLLKISIIQRLCIVYVSYMYRVCIVYLSCKLRSYMLTSTSNNGNYKGVAGKLYRGCRENITELQGKCEGKDGKM